MRYLSLFSGIGAHDLGFERAGWQCAGQVEIDPFCRAVLEKHWPHVPRFEDVRHVSAGDVLELCGPVDCITGGFACQDISVAGAGAGITRISRSGITFRNLFRLARQLRPSLLVIENVAALKSRGYDRIAAVLERIGYAVWPFLVAASDVGAPHLRRRVWIVGMRDDRRLFELANTEDSGRQGEGERRQPELTGARSTREDRSTLANPCSAGRKERHAPTFADRQGLSGGDAAQHQWPARPGEPQHEWEAPRLVYADRERGDCRDSLAIGQAKERTPTHGAGDECSTIGRSARDSDRSSTRKPARGRGSRGCSGQESSANQSAPRLVESPMGGTASRSAGRLGGFARRNALKAFGNANPPQVAELIARTINATLAHLEAGAA